MTDHFDQWRRALAGEKVPMHEGEPWCGYFATQDRKSTVKAAKWPKIACAIWRDAAGNLRAERAGEPVPPEWLWPYCAKTPITYETYAYWHEHKAWPEEAEAA
jgi:hypothetical protein